MKVLNSYEITKKENGVENVRNSKVSQKEDKLKAGGAWQNEMNLVFTDALGGHYAHNTVTRATPPILEAGGRMGYVR